MNIDRHKVDTYVSSLAEAFGKEVTAKRVKLGLSRMQLAKKALVSYRWLQSIEDGEKMPSFYIVASLSMALDTEDWESLRHKTHFSYRIVGNIMYLSGISKPEE